MERNTLLAIALSVLVLFTYQTIFVPPKQARPLNVSQPIGNKSVSEINNTSSATQQNLPINSTNTIDKSIDYVVRTPNKVFSYSNVGGSLHNIDFIKNDPFPLTDILSVNDFENSPFQGQKTDPKTIAFVFKNKDFLITKEYSLKDKNLMNVRMEIKNISEISNLKDIFIKAFEIDTSHIDTTKNSRNFALYEYSVSANNKIFRKGNAVKFSDKNYRTETNPIDWIGFRDHYQAFIIKPEFETAGYEIKAESNNQLSISLKPSDENLAPGQSAVFNFTVYVGPQNPWLMKKYGKGFDKIIAFSNFAIVEWIAQGIFYTIFFFHFIFKSWGIAIILISILIYGMTYPLTMKSMISMRKMQEVQPKIAALKERYKNDPQKQQAEMMEIYRREKINPFGGCLPFLIQMPFFMALYQILWRAQYFQGQKFLWIKDLAQPDRLIIFPFYLPLFGNELNILPILTGCIMFLQQRISSKNIVITDEQQAMQQKMMMYILPVMMVCMFYRFVSSWALYFLIFYILSTITQLKVAKILGKK